MARILLTPITRGLVVESPHPSLDGHLKAQGIDVTRVDALSGEGALIDALQATQAQVLFKRSRMPVTRALIEACPNLHAVQLCCIGDDSVDKDACAEHGVMVFNDPFSNARSVVELVVGQMIALSRRLYETDVHTHRHGWEKSHAERWEILGKRVGIVGLGNIGRQVAKALTGLGCEVWFFDSRPVAQEVGVEMGWRRCDDLADLFRNVDVITAHTSAKDAWGRDNEGLLDDVLPLLGADRDANSPRIFLNLARGNMHATQPLLDAVRSGAIRRAAVDVYPEEPTPGGTWHNPYADEPRIACTPHIGAATQEAQPRIAQRVARTVGGFSRFGTLRDCVYAPRLELDVPTTPKPGEAILAVVHSTARGTKKAVQDAIYAAEASTLGSAHQDFPNGLAYDLSVLDRPLPPEGIEELVAMASSLAKDDNAIRAVRQVVVPQR